MTRAAWGAIAGALVGLTIGYALWGPEGPVVETPALAVRQADASLVLERAPDPAAKPKHVIPSGGKVERLVTVTVQPTPSKVLIETDSVSAPTEPRCTCAPVHVDLSLLREPNGMRRVVASARGGTILGGVDIPVESARPARVLRWAAGLERDVVTGRIGAAIERDFDRVLIVPLPLRLGLSHVPGPSGGHWSARAMFRF